MARPRKLVADKKLQGTYRKYQEPDGEPITLPAQCFPAPPAKIGDTMTEEEMDVYRLVEPVISSKGILNVANLHEFIRYCRLVTQSEMLNQQILKDIKHTESGTEFHRRRAIDRVKMQKTISEQCSILARRFGLDPLSLDALRLEKEQQDNELGDILK